MGQSRQMFRQLAATADDAVSRISASARAQREKGAITVAESLIALAVGTALLLTWTSVQTHRQEVQQAQLAGRMIAAYAGAVARWLGDDPPDTAGTYGISDLQDCTSSNGVRYLPCVYGTGSTIPYLEGTGVTFGSLEIVVSLPSQGPVATVDFGVIRRNDDNEDGKADSRPDLAAIALTRAREESAPGAFGYFELSFARDDPTGLVTDPGDSAFDQDDLDDLARIQATAGANIASPFLRTDGANEMVGTITFENGVQLAMESDGLQVSATGDIEFEADVTLADATVESLDVSTQLSVTPADGVTGDGFDRLDQSEKVDALEDQVADIAKRTPPACTPTDSELWKEMNKKGYLYAERQDGSIPYCNGSCRVNNKCGNYVNGRYQRGTAYTGNPLTYYGRDPADLSCLAKKVNYYTDCDCIPLTAC